MSTGWKVWFWILAIAGVAGGVSWAVASYRAYDGNVLLNEPGINQVVVTLWLTNDLMVGVMGEIAILLTAFVSYLIWRGSQSTEELPDG